MVVEVVAEPGLAVAVPRREGGSPVPAARVARSNSLVWGRRS